MITLTCECCGHTAEYADGDAAFSAGWDEPTHFPGCPTTCDLCPSAIIVTAGVEKARVRHAASHARWEKEGRPSEFETAEECRLDGVDPEKFARFVEALKGET